MAKEKPFGDYKLIRRLGCGGMAEVFLAEKWGPLGFRKVVALKRILPHLAQDSRFVAMFTHEARLAARLHHPFIAQTFDFGEQDGAYYIAMEYVPGANLYNIQRQGLSYAQTALIGQQISEALSYAHALCDELDQPLNIVHRDISPQNIVISNTAKLLDFGIARACNRATYTRTGDIKGKLAYMAPEQARGEETTPLSDQFSLGVVLWECLMRRRLFEAPSEVLLLQKVCAGDIPPLEHVPEVLACIVERALAIDPSKRFPNLQTFGEGLASYVATVRPLPRLDFGPSEADVRPKTRSMLRGTIQFAKPKQFRPRTLFLLACLGLSIALFFALSIEKARSLQAETTPAVKTSKPRIDHLKVQPSVSSKDVARPAPHEVDKATYERALLKKLGS